MGEFYLCAKEGVYQVDPPHKHKTQFDASACTQKWAIKLALENDKLRTHAEVRWEMIESMALTCHELRTALELFWKDQGFRLIDEPRITVKKAIGLKPAKAEKQAALMKKVCEVAKNTVDCSNPQLGAAVAAYEAAKKEE